MLPVERVAKRVDMLRRENHERDQRHQTVYDARSQRLNNIAPGSLPDSWPKQITANQIDIAARQLAENLAPLPSINCDSGTMTSERSKKFAARRTKIAYGYIINSNLRTKMPTGCDWYLTYGSMPIVVDPDWERGGPVMRIDDPMGTYTQTDNFGRVISYTKVWKEPVHVLAAKFPQHAAAIAGREGEPFRGGEASDALVEVIKYQDKDQHLLYMPERGNLVLSRMENRLGRVAVALAEKPKWDKHQRGQFDDTVWPMLAYNRMQILGLEATQKSVRAPLALPSDVQQLSFGDDGIIRTESPEKIRRVGMDVPQVAWQQSAVIGEEIQRGTRTPKAATGDVDASIITGKGVEALGSGYDVQIATGQLMIGAALEQALEICFAMDEAYWPDARKMISGVINGTPFEESYTPSKDIRGNHRASVSYGFASGMNPNQALVFLLQLRGDQLVPRDFVQRQLPMDVDVAQLQAQVDTELIEDSLKQGVAALLSSIGVMAQQGMDPTQLLSQAAEIIKLREKYSLHEAVLRAFAPKEQEQGAGSEAPGEPGTPAASGPPGVAPGQAHLGPGGQPDLQTLLAGLTNRGQPDLRASVRRRIPA